MTKMGATGMMATLLMLYCPEQFLCDVTGMMIRNHPKIARFQVCELLSRYCVSPACPQQTKTCRKDTEGNLPEQSGKKVIFRHILKLIRQS